MKLTDLIAPERVLVDLRVSDKTQLLTDLSAKRRPGLGLMGPAVLTALAAREALGSTGLGRGFALPHARVAGVERLAGLFIRLARPIDFAAIDGQPVDLVFLLLIPPAGADHVAALAAIAREMRDEAAVKLMRRAPNAAALYQQLIAGAPPAR